MKSPAGLIILFAAMPAFGRPPIVVTGEPLPSVQVSYADLNLARPSDVNRLHWRVKAAARSLCIDGTRNPLVIEAMDRECYSTAIDKADRDIDQVVAQNRLGMGLTAATRVIVVSAK
jgi:UrcA family protein